MCDRTNEINELEMTQQIETMTVKLENVHNFYVQSSCSAPCTVKHLSTLWNCANQSQVSHHGNIFDPPPNSSWSYRATSSAPMVDGFSVWLIRRSGIPCRTACGIRLLAGTVSDNLWRHFCLLRTDAFSALEVSRRCAIKINFLLTYLLTSVRLYCMLAKFIPISHIFCSQAPSSGLWNNINCLLHRPTDSVCLQA